VETLMLGLSALVFGDALTAAEVPDCWLEVSIRKVLRPATSAQFFFVSVCLNANAEMVPIKFLKSLFHIYVHA
jgi:hypothetical protein